MSIPLEVQVADLKTDCEMLRKAMEEKLTIRDQFAMAALTGLLFDYHYGSEKAAKACYEYADAMMEARKP